MKKLFTIHASIILMGMISSQAWADNSCRYLEGTWKSHRDSGFNKHNGNEFDGYRDEELRLQGEQFVYIIRDEHITKGQFETYTGSYSCNKGKNNNYVIKQKFPNVVTTHYIKVSEDGLKWSGYFIHGELKGRDNELDSYYTRVSPIPRLTKIEESAVECITKKDSASSETYTLQNICNDAINLKYTFNRSKPFAGTYVTLQPKQETFETANQDEKYKFLACIFPGVPTAINGKCK